jgi:hypothetical protein
LLIAVFHLGVTMQKRGQALRTRFLIIFSKRAQTNAAILNAGILNNLFH